MLGNVFGRFSVPENNFTKYGFKKPDRLFDPIIGFDDIKEIFQLSINADKPVHLLLVGPPASAKSLFMSCLTKLDRSYYAVGSSSTKSGIFDYLFEHKPRYFIIDEIEKMNKRDQANLLGLMESGLLSELKHRQQRETQLKTWVFASANNADKLVFDKLSSNIRECIRIARLADNNIAKVQRIVDMLTTYSNRRVKIGT